MSWMRPPVTWAMSRNMITRRRSTLPSLSGKIARITCCAAAKDDSSGSKEGAGQCIVTVSLMLRASMVNVYSVASAGVVAGSALEITSTARSSRASAVAALARAGGCPGHDPNETNVAPKSATSTDKVRKRIRLHE
jgi:hypothetical protein